MQAFHDRLGPRARWLLPGIGLAAFAAFVALYWADAPLYFAIMKIAIKLPFHRLFVDWEWLPSSMECWQQGVNVYVGNTCYFWQGLAFNYSPLWLRLTFLPTGHAASVVTSVVLIVAFFLSLATLRPPRTVGELIVLLLALLSSATALLAERGNADLLMFLLVIGAANASLYALPMRLLGYGLLLVAGLLKFYPLVGLAIALRDRVWVLLLAFVVSVAAVLALIVAYRPELATMGQNLPRPSYFSLQFGAADLPGGLAAILTQTTVGSPSLLRSFLLAALSLGAAALALLGAWRAGLVGSTARLSERESVFLVLGAAMLCGCFFAGQSVIYRGIYFLLALPALLELARTHEHAWARRTLHAACGLIVIVLWMPVFEWALGKFDLAIPPVYQPENVLDGIPDAPFGIALWLVNELSWWFLITVLIATAGACLYATSPLVSAIWRRPGWRGLPDLRDGEDLVARRR